MNANIGILGGGGIALPGLGERIKRAVIKVLVDLAVVFTNAGAAIVMMHSR